MKILIYGLNYYPEIVGIGKYTTELADFFTNKGNDIRIVTSNKYFPDWIIKSNKFKVETINNSMVFRSPIYVPIKPNGFKRILHYLSFSLSSIPNLIAQIKWGPEIIIVILPTILIAPNILILKNLFLKSSKTWLHIQDLEIDAAKKLNIIKKNFLFNFLIYFELFIFKSFDKISTISNDMRFAINYKINNSKKIEIIRNWIDINYIKSKKENHEEILIIKENLKIKSTDIIVMYSGSLNKKQDIEVLIYAIKNSLKIKKIKWILSIEGPSKVKIINSLGNNNNLIITKLQPSEKLHIWLSIADIHILPQKSNINDTFMPSKLIGILASGVPVVSTTLKSSELGKLVSKAGIVTPPGNKKLFLNAILMLSKNKKMRQELGKKAQDLAINYYNKEKILNKFLIKLNDLKNCNNR